MRHACVLLLAHAAAALQLGHHAALRPVMRQSRLPPITLGFEVDTLKNDDIEQMGILNWPSLEKRTEEFEQSASDDEVMMIYCREGSAKLSMEGEADQTVTAGQLVMLNDGAVRWSELGEGGVTLLSTRTAVDDDDAEDTAAPAAPETPEDLSVKEAFVLLAGGLLFGVLLSTGVKLFTTPDGL